MIYELIYMKKALLLIILLIAALFGCSKTHDEYLSEAKELYKNEEYDKALSLYNKACEKGSLKGCMFLADVYKKGTVINTDNNTSLNYYKKSFLLANLYCQQNIKDACKTLSYLYENGLGTDIDLAKADNASSKACDLGDAASCYYQARVNADNMTAFILYNDKACQNNMDYACLVLGNTYLTGFNESMAEIEKDIEKGISYINKACEMNNVMCASLADIYISGDDLEQDYNTAVTYYETALKHYETLCTEKNDDNPACRNIDVIKSKYSFDNETIY